MENRNSPAPAPRSVGSEDVTTWALPEGAIARFGRGSIRDMAFSPDGQYFAVGTAIGLWLYELPTLSPIALWDTERGMTSGVGFSPDGSQIVTTTSGGNVKIWDIERGICTIEIGDHGKQEISNPSSPKMDNTSPVLTAAWKRGRFTSGARTLVRKSEKRKSTVPLRCLSALLFSRFKPTGR